VNQIVKHDLPVIRRARQGTGRRRPLGADGRLTSITVLASFAAENLDETGNVYKSLVAVIPAKVQGERSLT
jgi:hypothetical protein